MTDRSTIIISTRKFLSKHNQVKNVHNKVEALLKKVTNFKSICVELLKKGIPSFWDNNEYLIPHEIYHALLSQQRNEDSKFKELEKNLKGHVIVDKLSDDFDLLIQFKIILKNLPPLSYAQYIELEVLTKEMLDYEYLIATKWANVVKFTKKAQLYLG